MPYCKVPFHGLSSGLFYKTLRKKDIRVNGVRTSDNVCVHTGDEISIFLTDEFLFGKVNYEVVYEDENILLVNKPAGISVVEDDGEYCLTHVLQNAGQHDMLPLRADCSQTDEGYVKFPYPCHRIDRNTSGLVLFAKNKQALDILFEKFKNKEIEKHYYCVVLRQA